MKLLSCAEVTGRAVGRVDLAVLELGLPVQGHDGRGPDAVAIDPGQGAVHVGRVLAGEKRVAGAVGDLAQAVDLPLLQSPKMPRKVPPQPQLGPVPGGLSPE